MCLKCFMLKVIISELIIYIDIVEKVVNIVILCFLINCIIDILIIICFCIFYA